MIQCLARFHPTPSRSSARRIVSSDRTVALSPCSCATRASRASVQVLLAWPNGARRLVQERAQPLPLASPSAGTVLLGRGEPAIKAARPRVLNARMTLRTVCTAQPKPCAMARGRRPAALSSTIWPRRTVNALAARRLASSWPRSAPLGSRTKIGGCIPIRYEPHPLAQGLLRKCTRDAPAGSVVPAARLARVGILSNFGALLRRPMPCRTYLE